VLPVRSIRSITSLVAVAFFIAGVAQSFAAAPPAPAPAPILLPAPGAPGVANPLSPLGPGDSLNLHVFGQPDMDSVLTVADDGTINVPLAGSVQVLGLSGDQAARRIEKALKDGRFFVDPHVTLTVTQSLSQRVSVLGEVKTPGRYPVDSRTSIPELLAEAGDRTPDASSTIYVLRPDATGNVKRYPIEIQSLTGAGKAAQVTLRAGDTLYVPRADQFYIQGEVQKPGKYSIVPNLTVLQAISIGGGLTAKGSNRRFDIKRAGPNGQQTTLKAKPDDLIQPDDVIVVKESIF
jgi:polysaccharide export outer membrane protein